MDAEFYQIIVILGIIFGICLFLFNFLFSGLLLSLFKVKNGKLTKNNKEYISPIDRIGNHSKVDDSDNRTNSMIKDIDKNPFSRYKLFFILKICMVFLISSLLVLAFVEGFSSPIILQSGRTVQKSLAKSVNYIIATIAPLPTSVPSASDVFKAGNHGTDELKIQDTNGTPPIDSQYTLIANGTLDSTVTTTQTTAKPTNPVMPSVYGAVHR